MGEDSQVFLHRDEGLHRAGLRFYQTSALLMIDPHRVLVRRITGIAFDATVSTIHDDASSEIRTRLHLDFWGVGQTLGSMCSNWSIKKK